MYQLILKYIDSWGPEIIKLFLHICNTDIRYEGKTGVSDCVKEYWTHVVQGVERNSWE